MKKTRQDGTVQYYYYKKKIGRHKRAGRKKRKRQRGREWQEPWNYKIMRFDFRKQATYFGVYHDLDEVNYVKGILEKRNSEVVFPKKYTNNGRGGNGMRNFKSEYVIMKRLSDDETPVTKLRNEYGKFVDNVTTSENWAVYDKFPCVVEETFWVYGYNPKTDRKEFSWVYDNLVDPESGDIVMVYVYNNKVIFKRDEDFDFVICKNTADAIRMYNIIEEKSKKMKNVLMTGSASTKSGRGQYTIDSISEKTGWDRRKVMLKSTRS